MVGGEMNRNARSPAQPVDHIGTINTGLTKREYLAMDAMNAMLISAFDTQVLEPNGVAKCAVAYADALLEELDK